MTISPSLPPRLFNKVFTLIFFAQVSGGPPCSLLNSLKPPASAPSSRSSMDAFIQHSLIQSLLDFGGHSGISAHCANIEYTTYRVPASSAKSQKTAGGQHNAPPPFLICACNLPCPLTSAHCLLLHPAQLPRSGGVKNTTYRVPASGLVVPGACEKAAVVADRVLHSTELSPQHRHRVECATRLGRHSIEYTMYPFPRDSERAYYNFRKRQLRRATHLQRYRLVFLQRLQTLIVWVGLCWQEG
ncbi:hypothetical protein C8R43DRAFT_1126746 [Mycena crocata]|nr:hypothetical protein C8R43DRAFT_1126746 [Mycena crocata]